MADKPNEARRSPAKRTALAQREPAPRPSAGARAAASAATGLPEQAAKIVDELQTSGADNRGTHALLDDSTRKWRATLERDLAERLRIEPWTCFQAGCYLTARFDDQAAYEALSRRFANEQPLGSTVWGAASSHPMPLADGSLLAIWVTSPKETVAANSD